MFALLQKGGPIMWPLSLTSVVSLTVVIERVIFIIGVKMRRQPAKLEELLSAVERSDIPGAIRIGDGSTDFVARILTYALAHRRESFMNSFTRAANRELKRFNQGLPVLDTVITLAPLLGLLATVTGMIHAFGILGHRELDTPTVITGGIAEALIGTAFGLGIAVIALIPFNYLNACLEEARHEIEDTGTRLEIILKQSKPL